MYFIENSRMHEIEKLMQTVPNFRPRKSGVIVICNESSDEHYTLSEALAGLVAVIRNPVLESRIRIYMKESEGKPMNYRNEKHREVFEKAIQKKDKNNFALMSALYLLTADHALWQRVRKYAVDNVICFEQISLNGTTPNGYALFCAAKDLYLGTDFLRVSDLADKTVVPAKTFALICNAMAIRRFGLTAISPAKDGDRSC